MSNFYVNIAPAGPVGPVGQGGSEQQPKVGSMGNRIFRLNEIVRQVVREKLKELEEPIVRITIDSFRKILQEEKDIPDPFDCLKEQTPDIFHLEGEDYSFVNSMFNRDGGPNSMTMAPLYIKSNQNDEKILYIREDSRIKGLKDGDGDEPTIPSSRQDDQWLMTSSPNSDVEQEDEEEDDVPVVTKEINGKQVYVFLEDDVAKTFRGHAVYRRDIKDDGESEAGDIIGFLDDHDEYWEAVQNGGKIVGFEKDNLYVPTVKGTTYPEWEKMEPKD